MKLSNSYKSVTYFTVNCLQHRRSEKHAIVFDAFSKKFLKTFDKFSTLHYYYVAMRDWRNRQTRTFKGRVGDRVSSSLTSRTTAPRFSGCFIFKTALLRALTLLLRQQNRTPEICCRTIKAFCGDMAQMVERCVRNA